MNNPHIIRLDTIDSTNNYLRSYRGNDDIVVVTARHQTAGRGQGDHRWEDNAGQNLLFSIQVKPDTVPIDHQFVLAMAEALALKSALDIYTDDIRLKWPNDIYYHNRKLSGTLIETSVNGGNLKRMILGTGINVNQQRFYSDAPNPISLCQITGKEENIDTLLQHILKAFCRYYNMATEGNYAAISREYHQALYRREGAYRYRDTSGEFTAEITGVGYDGRITMRDSMGQLRRYAFKEVEFIIQQDYGKI